jgi:hypothetical protein
MNKHSWLKDWAVVGHFTWLILTPLLIFIGGGGWLIGRFDWNTRVIILFVVLGLVFAAVGVWSYTKQFLAMYDDLKVDLKQPAPKTDKRDYDY